MNLTDYIKMNDISSIDQHMKRWKTWTTVQIGVEQSERIVELWTEVPGNIKGAYFGWKRTYLFELESDATWFKLRWG